MAKITVIFACFRLSRRISFPRRLGNSFHIALASAFGARYQSDICPAVGEDLPSLLLVQPREKQAVRSSISVWDRDRGGGRWAMPLL